jgi:hypothetical protein
MGEIRLGGFRMVFACLDPAAVGQADRERHLQPAARALVHFSKGIHELTESGIEKAHELDLDDHALAPHRHADRGPQNAVLGEGRVDHPVGPELLVQAFGRAVDTADGPDVIPQ